MYSAICGEMASRGYVVVAIEHRYGTGPNSYYYRERNPNRLLLIGLIRIILGRSGRRAEKRYQSSAYSP